MKVPFLDLKTQLAGIRNEITVAIQEVLESTAFAGGPFVTKFEREFAAFCDCQHAIGVSSGTSALWLVLLATGVRVGDEVITVPNTFIATAEAITFSGATPVFVDIDERTYNLDPQKLEAAITSRTKAIIPVHLFGQMADMNPILEIAKQHNLLVIEDAAQAHGASYKSKPAGSFGDAGCFSFYPGKNLGAYGEAGAIVTNNSDLAAKIAMLRDHGQSQKYCHDYIGWNARMDGIQAAVLNVKLRHLKMWNEARRNLAGIYSERLADCDRVILPHEAEYAEHVYHIYAIRARNRNGLLRYLADRDIHCGIHYPLPLHLQKAYKWMGHSKGSFPVSEKCQEELISLPIYPELGVGQVEYVTDEIKKFVSAL